MRLTAAALADAGCISNVGEAEMAIRRLTAADPVDPVDRNSVLSGPELAAVEAYVERRRDGEPPQYILGGCEFMRRWISLDETTYIPRPWTAAMVLRGVAILKSARSPKVVIDVGTGSGAIACVVAESVLDSHVWALDVDQRSFRWAQINTAAASNVTVLLSDLFGALPDNLAGRVDLVIGSLPYVPSMELAHLPRDYREHEPRAAHDGGPNGLAIDLRALQDARRWLRSGGRVLLELGHRQGGPLAADARRLGYRRIQVHVDEDGDDLFLECRR